MAKQKREFLKKNDELAIALVRDGDRPDDARKIVIRIVKVIGEGSTCVAYEGIYRPPGSKYPISVIVKELYPDMPGIRRSSDKRLDLDASRGSKEFALKRRQFEDNIEAYRQVSRVPELKITIPRLIGVGYENGEIRYQLFDIYKGKTLSDVDWKKVSIIEQFNVIKKLAEFFELWFDKGFMLLDLSPSNIMYLEESRVLQFIDFDSLLIKRGRHWEKGVSGYRVNSRYLPKALRQAMFGGTGNPDWRRIERLIGETTCHYYLGMQLFSILSLKEVMTEVSKDDITRQIGDLAKRYPVLAGNSELWQEIQNHIETLLCKLLSPEIGRGYISLSDIIRDLDDTIKLLGRTTDSGIILQRYELLASSLIEEYPAYKYFSHIRRDRQYVYDWDSVKCENVDKTIDVLIAGNHPLRKALIKYLISCLQMNHVRIRLHLFSNDVRRFWKDIEESWPLIGRACKVKLTGLSKTVYDNEEPDHTLVDRELAEIYLYPVSGSEEISEKCLKDNIRYIMLLGDDALNKAILEGISADENRAERFVAFLCRKNVPRRDTYSKHIRLFFISEESASDTLDTELRTSRIFNRGFYVHASYELGNNPYASRKFLRKQYENDSYSQSNSIRPALHAAYKLVSVGVDPESETAAWDYYRKVFGDEKILLDQMALEHRSWTAFMIMSGARCPEGIDELDDYAFRDGMTWKNNNDKAHIVHPCIAASSSRGRLCEEVWDEFDKIETLDDVKTFLADIPCDELDKASMGLHFIIKSRRKDYEKEIEKCLKDMRNSRLYKDNSSLRTLTDELVSLWQSLKAEEGAYDGIRRWKETVEYAEECIGDNKQCKEYLKKLKMAVLPFTAISLRHDFRNSDEDIVRAAPQLFLRTDTPYGKSIGTFWIMRYLSGNKWLDLRAALYTEPEKLVLLADYSEMSFDVMPYKEDCECLLQQCGIETCVEIRDKTYMYELPADKRVFFDLTGPGGKFLDPGSLVTPGADVHKILFNGSAFVSMESDHSVEILNKRPALSVEDWMCLHDCTTFDLGEGKRREKLSVNNTVLLWNIMRRLSSEEGEIGDSASTGWSVFMNMLKKWRTFRTYEADFTLPGVSRTYSVNVETGDLTRTGLTRTLTYLSSAKIIENLAFAADEEDEEETVTFETMYKEIGDSLCEICGEITKFGKVSAVLVHDTVYIKYFCRRITMNDDDLTEAEKRILDNPEYKELLSRIIKQTPVKDGRRIITFRSNIVFESLISSKELFKAIIYAECGRKGVFDDFVLDTGFEKCGCKYEPQLIGIKENFLYPIMIDECADNKSLRLQAIDMMDELPGTVIYFIVTDDKTLQKEGSRYCCLTPDDVDEPLANGAFSLHIASEFRRLEKNNLQTSCN